MVQVSLPVNNLSGLKIFKKWGIRTYFTWGNDIIIIVMTLLIFILDLKSSLRCSVTQTPNKLQFEVCSKVLYSNLTKFISHSLRGCIVIKKINYASPI